jgi:fimbrial chaperone protein
MDRTLRALLLHVLSLMTLLFSSAATASTSLLIWPLDPTIEAGQRTGVLWLENVGKAPVTLQIRVLAWDQEEFKDRYGEQNVVVSTPPFATVAPGKKQLVRLTLTAPLAAAEERAFRILVDEIPGPTPVVSGGLRLQMRYSLPLFAYGDGLWRKRQRTSTDVRAEPSLSWKLVDQDGARYLQVRNAGQASARLSQVRLVNSARTAPGAAPDSIDVAKGLLGYVLPGRVMRWPAPAGITSSHQLQVQLETNGPSVTVPGE